MKVGQNSVVRWISKLGADRASQSTRGLPSRQLHQLSAEQLRQVCGGNGSATSAPTKGW
jgi:hypothetical protein